MNEGRSILAQVLAVLIATIMLGMFGVILVVNTDIWQVFARQTETNEAIREYSEYASYDQITCRGQDIMSLVSKTTGDPFVVICSNDGTVLAVSYDAYTGSVELSGVDYSYASACPGIGSIINNGTLRNVSGCQVWNYSSTYPGTDVLQEFFLNGPGAASVGRYASYRTYLIYDNSASTEVVGVVAVKEG